MLIPLQICSTSTYNAQRDEGGAGEEGPHGSFCPRAPKWVNPALDGTNELERKCINDSAASVAEQLFDSLTLFSGICNDELLRNI